MLGNKNRFRNFMLLGQNFSEHVNSLEIINALDIVKMQIFSGWQFLGYTNLLVQKLESLLMKMSHLVGEHEDPDWNLCWIQSGTHWDCFLISWDCCESVRDHREIIGNILRHVYYVWVIFVVNMEMNIPRTPQNYSAALWTSSFSISLWNHF